MKSSLSKKRDMEESFTKRVWVRITGRDSRRDGSIHLLSKEDKSSLLIGQQH